MKEEQIKLLNKAIPEWAVKQHPSKTYLSTIDPMAVIERLNEVFGVGKWHFTTEFIETKTVQQKSREAFMTAVKGTLLVPSEDIHIEQYGGSTNDDLGDALKGGATDALTKCASYLGVGASIYRGQGNKDLEQPMSLEDAFKKLATATSEEELTNLWKSLPGNLQKDSEIVAKCKEIKEGLQEIIN